MASLEAQSRWPSSQKSSNPPNKRSCIHTITTPSATTGNSVSVQQLLRLSKDEVYALPKQGLREAFLALQEYALKPYPLLPAPLPLVPASSIPTNLPLFLRLPREIREMIYLHLLSAPSPTPIRGPHPRQLQTHICLSQSFPPALLLLNRQIRTEALPLFYGSPSQVVHVTIDYNVWVHKTRRSDLVLSSDLTAAIRHLHVSIHLGSEKRNSKPGDIEADARMTEVKKGVRKLGKWLAAAEVQSLKISWQEPPQTFTWDQKREVLDGMKALRAVQVEEGEINWGLNWNKGRKFRFEVEYFKELERCQQEELVAASDIARPRE